MAKWVIDSDHSVAAFSVRHLMVAHVRGQFNTMQGVIHFDPADLAGASVNISIDVPSLTTGNAKRDEHLRSPDFFDAAAYPEMKFRSSSVERIGESSLRVDGDLTIHGITRPAVLEIDYAGPVISPFGGEVTMGFSTSFVINREDFGITWNVPMDNGGIMVSKEVWINLDTEADKEL